MSRDILSKPIFFDFGNNNHQLITSLIDSSASFYRTFDNSNIEITIPLGTDPLSVDLFLSPDVYLPSNIFNSTNSNTIITYPNNKDVQILQNITLFHDILIQFKITQNDNTNFINQRELRATLVNDSNTIYNNAIFANQQPDTGTHDVMILKGYIDHLMNDIVKIKLNISQNDKNGKSDSKLTIFRISWNIL
jgi:hypothetical protein